MFKLRYIFVVIFSIFYLIGNAQVLDDADGNVQDSIDIFQEVDAIAPLDSIIENTTDSINNEDLEIEPTDEFDDSVPNVEDGESSEDFDLKRAGMGGSDLPDLNQEFSKLPHDRGTLSMARSSDPNSANSQFFICFKSAPHLDRQYTVFGKVISGMEFVDQIKKGEPGTGSVDKPDYIEKIEIK